MTEYRMRYRLQTLGRPRSAWAEWGLFLLAVIAAVGLLAALAFSSPIFSGPRPLPDSDPKVQAGGGGGGNGGGGNGGGVGGGSTQPPPPDLPQ